MEYIAASQTWASHMQNSSGYISNLSAAVRSHIAQQISTPLGYSSAMTLYLGNLI